MSRRHTSTPPALEPAGWVARAAASTARLLDRHLAARLVGATTISILHVSAILTLPPTSSTLAFTVATMVVGVILLIVTGAWKTTHRWVTLWLLTSITVPAYAPVVLLVGQVWVLNRAWIERRGLIETVRHSPEIAREARRGPR